jgi:hypothetical protein
LRNRALAETVADRRAWVRCGEERADAPAGLDPDKERRVLAARDAR